ncbi:hypothetical protein [Aquibacillus albus]|uniref:DNA-binding NarL/FixJ family response regulator n=1 Tax=Aquibacillus albus TaxID=1168171 RepID=A0ABS2MV50_9BACI|nr:hypothetical protein [Aquibacillus albus]MBM7569663.1 DNA-binding NarL/FixJ family response regulator [Aquibacillus albus]
MIYAIICLFTTSILLLFLSFFMKDRFKSIEDQLEQVSISTLQETYQLQKKVKILEEELLSDDITHFKSQPLEGNKTPLMKKIIRMHIDGLSIQDIAKETKLSEYDVHSIINQNKLDARGGGL